MGTTTIEDRLSRLENEMGQMRAHLEHLDTVRCIQRGLLEYRRGQFRAARDVVAELRAKHQLPAK